MRRRRKRRGRGISQWKKAPQAPRKKQAGAANDERDRDRDGTMEHMSCGFKTAACSLGNILGFTLFV